MAYYLEIPATGYTPYILIDEANGYLKLSGESFLGHVFEFFKQVDEWLEGYLKTDFGHLVFDCQMQYFNSSTAKLLLNILLAMDEHVTETNKVTVNWYAEKDNDTIIECGEEYRDELENVRFNLIIT